MVRPHLETVETASREETARLSTSDLRRRFLLGELFAPGELRLYATDLDRMVVGGAQPSGPLRLPDCPELGTAYFTERRELGVINIGGPGRVLAGGESYSLERLDCLYVGIGEPDIRFEADGGGAPQFYLLSAPAHAKRPTRKITREEAVVMELGDAAHASRRRIVQYICPQRVASCQLVMGFTELEPGSVWNTMPAHTHARRMEVYLYFDLGDGMVVHLMGAPGETRHLVVRDRQAVLSPGWSIHSGAGTNNYRFIWGMAGENQSFSDMDALPAGALR